MRSPVSVIDADDIAQVRGSVAFDALLF